MEEHLHLPPLCHLQSLRDICSQIKFLCISVGEEIIEFHKNLDSFVNLFTSRSYFQTLISNMKSFNSWFYLLALLIINKHLVATWSGSVELQRVSPTKLFPVLLNLKCPFWTFPPGIKSKILCWLLLPQHLLKQLMVCSDFVALLKEFSVISDTWKCQEISD